MTSAVLTVKEFAAYIGVSPTTGWRVLGTYRVPHVRPAHPGGAIRVLKTDADAYLAARRVTSAADARKLTDGRRR